MEFRLKGDYIELDNLLKALRLAGSGAEARQSIEAGMVRVNGQPETRIRRKLRNGDIVDFGAERIGIVA